MTDPRRQAESVGDPYCPPRPQRGHRGGELIELAPYRRRQTELQLDASVNAEWDALKDAVQDAWTWRDPESLMILEALFQRLRTRVFEDWGYPLRKG